MFVNPDLNYFLPQVSCITAITPIADPTGNYTTLTTAFPHNYLTGLMVRFQYPETYGMNALLTGYYQLAVIDPFTVAIDVDTFLQPPFVIPVDGKQSPQIVPEGDKTFSSGNQVENSVVNSGSIRPQYGWTNTTFPWVNRG